MPRTLLLLTPPWPAAAELMRRHGGAAPGELTPGAAFERAADALECAQAIRAAAAAQGHPPLGMALYADQGAGGLGAPAVQRAQALLASARQGQIVLSAAAAAQLRAQPAPPELRDWGVRRLIDLLPPEHLFALAGAGETDLEPQTLDAAPTNLPAQPTALIGREQALREVAGLLRQPATRLLTLTGPGGIGKTRLAVHAAAQLLGSFPDGVWFVDLAPLHQPDQLLPAIAQACGLGAAGTAELSERLAAALRDKAVLLVLDNAEHMPDAAAVLADLLARLPSLRMLVTSRERLRLSNEYEFVVPPLELGLDRDRPFDPLAYPEAVRLFLARAPAGTQGGPGPEEGDVVSIAAICQRLDGLPLAIELAAARSKIFSPAALLARLHNSLPLLTGGSRDLPARQQTLRGAIAWSYDLLSPAEQTLLRRLAVFVGGWEIEALEHICPDPAQPPGSPGGLDAAACLDGLTSLIDKSLVHQAESGAEPRFRLLQTIRDFALEQLEAAGELAALRARHCRYYAGLAEASEPSLRSSQQQFWLARLTYEQENLRAALHWSLEENRDAAARLAGSLWRFWMMRSQWTEGRMWISSVLAGGDELPVERRAALLLGEGALAHVQGDATQAAIALSESLAAWDQTSDRIGKALTLNALGGTRRVQGRFDEAQHLFSASLDIWRDLDDPAGVATVLHNMGTIFSHRGDHQRARPRYEEAVALQRRHGFAWMLAASLEALGYGSNEEGDFAQASTFYRESFELRTRMGNRAGIAVSFINFAEVAYGQGDFDAAERLLAQSAAAAQGIDDINHRLYWTLNTAAIAFERERYADAQRLFEEGLAISQRQGNTFRQVITLARLAQLAIIDRRLADGESYLQQGLALARRSAIEPGIALVGSIAAHLAKERGEPARAAALCAAADTMFALLRVKRAAPDQARHDALVRSLRTALPPKQFAAAWEYGQAATVAQALDWEPPAAPPAASPAGGTDPAGLSERERDVLRLLAQGMTNAEAAAALGLSLFTVKAHIRSIYSKLGVSTRTAAARYAHDNHLV